MEFTVRLQSTLHLLQFNAHMSTPANRIDPELTRIMSDPSEADVIALRPCAACITPADLLKAASNVVHRDDQRPWSC